MINHSRRQGAFDVNRVTTAEAKDLQSHIKALERQACSAVGRVTMKDDTSEQDSTLHRLQHSKHATVP